MKCFEIKKRIPAFFDGEVSEKEKFYISEHLKTCHECQNEVENLSQISNILDLVGEVEISPYFISRLKVRIDEEKNKSILSGFFINWRKRLMFPLGIAALFLIAVFGGGYLGRLLKHRGTGKDTVLAEEIARVAGVASFEDFPENSLFSDFNNLLTEGEE